MRGTLVDYGNRPRIILLRSRRSDTQTEYWIGNHAYGGAVHWFHLGTTRFHTSQSLLHVCRWLMQCQKSSPHGTIMDRERSCPIPHQNSESTTNIRMLMITVLMGYTRGTWPEKSWEKGNVFRVAMATRIGIKIPYWHAKFRVPMREIEFFSLSFMTARSKTKTTRCLIILVHCTAQNAYPTDADQIVVSLINGYIVVVVSPSIMSLINLSHPFLSHYFNRRRSHDLPAKERIMIWYSRKKLSQPMQ